MLAVGNTLVLLRSQTNCIWRKTKWKGQICTPFLANYIIVQRLRKNAVSSSTDFCCCHFLCCGGEGVRRCRSPRVTRHVSTQATKLCPSAEMHISCFSHLVKVTSSECRKLWCELGEVFSNAAISINISEQIFKMRNILYGNTPIVSKLSRGLVVCSKACRREFYLSEFFFHINMNLD